MKSFVCHICFLVLCCSLSCSGFAISSLPSQLRSSRQLRNGYRSCVSVLPPPGESGNPNEDFSSFGKKVDDNMATLNSRIQKLKDTVADTVEPLKRESTRVAQKIPDPRDMMPSTLPKWAAPLAVIVGLSVLATLVQTRETLDSAGLATGSL